MKFPTPLDFARSYDGLREIPGSRHCQLIVKMLQARCSSVHDDETAWCSAFMYHVMRQFDIPSQEQDYKITLRARTWLLVGEPIGLSDARPGWDIAILRRGNSDQPGPEVIDAPGHVGFIYSFGMGRIDLLGGNQSDMVCISSFPAGRVLGVRSFRPTQEELLEMIKGI